MKLEPSTIDLLLESAADPALIVDADLVIGQANDLAAKLVALSREELVGRNWTEVFGGDEGDAIREALGRESFDSTEHEASLELPADRKVAGTLSVRAYEGEDGAKWVLATLRDETELRSLRTETHQQKERLLEFHASTMELAIGLSECFEVLNEAGRGNLRARVSERTLAAPDELVVSLAKALNDTITRIQDQVETIKHQQFAIQELSTPILQLWDNVLALPVIGVVDTRRSVIIMERLLTEITARQASFVILDITGVEVVDTKTADHFIKLIRAADLLGAKCILTGIRPAVAQTLVEIGVDLSSVTTLRDLQEGLHECLRLVNSGEKASDAAS